jgi:hypothetical protein
MIVASEGHRFSRIIGSLVQRSAGRMLSKCRVVNVGTDLLSLTTLAPKVENLESNNEDTAEAFIATLD